METIIYNHQLLPLDNFKISPFNRGFLFGDGFFDSILVLNQQIKYWEQHWNRIIRAAEALQIELSKDFTKANIHELMVNLIHQNPTSPVQRIRITCWRGGDGLYLPYSNQIEFLITCSPSSLAPESKAKCGLFSKMYKPFNNLSFFKNLGSSIYIQASIEKQKQNLDEIIILGEGQSIAECSSSNIFLIKNDNLITPALTSGCIEGVLRGEILQWASKNGIIYREKMISKEELLESETIFTANITGISLLTNILDKSFNKSNDIYNQLRKAVQPTLQ